MVAIFSMMPVVFFLLLSLQEYTKLHKFFIPDNISPSKLIKSIAKELKKTEVSCRNCSLCHNSLSLFGNCEGNSPQQQSANFQLVVYQRFVLFCDIFC